MNRGIRSLEVIDVAAQYRLMYGANADFFLNRELPEHDYRFQIVTSEGGRITFEERATAADVAGQIRTLEQEWTEREAER